MLVISNIPGSNQNLEKTNTKKKQRNHKRHCKKNSDPWRGTQDRLDRGHRSDLSVFLSTFGQASQNIKKHRLQTWRGSEERLDRGHRSKLFICFVFWVCVHCWTDQPKQKKIRPMERDSGEAGQET